MKLVPFDFVPSSEIPKRPDSDRSALKKGCKFILEIGNKIGFPEKTILTAQFYFRKFYQTRPLSSAPFMDIALTAVILASKVEESFEKIKNVLITAFLILNKDNFKGRTEDIKITDEHRNRVIQYERDLLISIGFHFSLSHPHFLVIKLAHSLTLSKESAQKAWKLLDETYQDSDIILSESPHTLALTALNLCAGSEDEKLKIREFARKNNSLTILDKIIL